MATRRVILVDPKDRPRSVLAGRLRAQSFTVEDFADPAEAANFALANPPAALIADVWMSGVSGVQLCRLLRSEPATTDVPIVLRAEGNAPRARFWAEQAGAAAYVPRGRIGDLVRALNSAIASTPESADFFTQLAQIDIRDRIAEHLDQALFESVIASSVRALGSCESFERLFDLLSQFVCRISSYRWLALVTSAPVRVGLHTHPAVREESLLAARSALAFDDKTPKFVVEDEDAYEDGEEATVVACEVKFGPTTFGKLALMPLEADRETVTMVELIAQELGGPLRIATLVEESQRLAMYDPLTGIMNRRAFVERLQTNILEATKRKEDLAVMLMDIDYFKSINDTFGHKAGDQVLEQMGRLIRRHLPEGASVARWGGEEFVVALPRHGVNAGKRFADQLRQRIAELQVPTDLGEPIVVTASAGVAQLLPTETLDSLVERADHAMYEAKVRGRDQVHVADTEVRISVNSRRVIPSRASQLSIPSNPRRTPI